MQRDTGSGFYYYVA